VSRLRGFDIAKRPGVAETIDWANAVSFLGAEHLDEEIAAATLGTVLKDHDDQRLAVDRLGHLVQHEADAAHEQGVEQDHWPSRARSSLRRMLTKL